MFRVCSHASRDIGRGAKPWLDVSMRCADGYREGTATSSTRSLARARPPSRPIREIRPATRRFSSRPARRSRRSRRRTLKQALGLGRLQLSPTNRREREAATGQARVPALRMSEVRIPSVPPGSRRKRPRGHNPAHVVPEGDVPRKCRSFADALLNRSYQPVAVRKECVNTSHSPTAWRTC
jgi:hypothetical protein